MAQASSAEAEYIWHDREIRFDIHPRLMQLRRGEVLIDSINSVEDTKGNNGERGSLSVTNLRIMWCAHRNPRTNLSIGFACIQNINIKTTNSRLRGNVQGLHLMTRFNKSRFEFIFTSLVRASPRLFTTVQSVGRAYETSRLYRDLKLRGAVIKDKQLIMLPSEQVYNKIMGVWNLSSDQGNLGTFFITNVRVVWHANLAENFNVSIPYMQMRTIKIRESRFGLALVIETMPASGGYILGFRIHPTEELEKVFKELTSLHMLFSSSPVFGVDFTAEETPPEAMKAARVEDDTEIVEAAASDAFAAYFAEADKESDRKPVYSESLGLAVESLPEGFTIEKLWSVV